ncbi:hypothetical protein RZS08_50040, partial [Arthrospira platensis SPKY1]|nr:hypothetical protein [Arthrospira platensis SPKY1]
PEQHDAHDRVEDDRRRNQGGLGLRRRPALNASYPMCRCGLPRPHMPPGEAQPALNIASMPPPAWLY